MSKLCSGHPAALSQKYTDTTNFPSAQTRVTCCMFWQQNVKCTSTQRDSDFTQAVTRTVRLGFIRLSYFRLGQVRLGQLRLGQVRLGQVSSGQVRLGQFRLSQVRLGQVSELMTNEMHNSYNQFYSTIFCLLYMFRTNLVVRHQEHGIIYCITQYNRYNRAVT